MKLFVLSASIVALVFTSPVVAGDFAITPEEKQMCTSVLFSQLPAHDAHDPNYGHMHHYCDCVRFTNRAYRAMGRNKEDFDANLSEALGGCEYVIGHVAPDWPVLADIHLQMGTIRSLQGKPSLAATEYTKALNGQKKPAGAYVGLANYFIHAKDKKRALQLVSEGLKYNPQSKSLQRMYQETGGVLPYPAAIIEPVASPTGLVKPVAAESAAATKVPEQAHIGSPTDPWCRFCPDTPPAQPALTPATPGVIQRGAP